MPYHTGNGNGNGGQMRTLTGREAVDAMRTSDTTSAGERSNAIKLSRNSIVNTRTPNVYICLLYTSPSPRDNRVSRMPSSA